MKNLPRFLFHGTTNQKYGIMRQYGIKNSEYLQGIQCWGSAHPYNDITNAIGFAIKRSRGYKKSLDEEPVLLIIKPNSELQIERKKSASNIYHVCGKLGRENHLLIRIKDIYLDSAGYSQQYEDLARKAQTAKELSDFLSNLNVISAPQQSH